MKVKYSSLHNLLLGLFLFASVGCASTQSFSLEHSFPVPAEQLWKTVAEDYGNIAVSHPSLVRSEYLGDSAKGELGAMRRIAFKENGKKALDEKIVAWDPQNRRYQVQLVKATGFPIDEDKTLATLTFVDTGDNKSTFTFDFSYGTKPKFMAPVAKGSFKRLLEDYFIALEHYLLTGEKVNATTGNFKAVKKAYNKRHPN